MLPTRPKAQGAGNGQSPPPTPVPWSPLPSSIDDARESQRLGWGGCLGEGPWLAPVRVPTPQLQKHCRPPTSAPGAFWESGADPPRGPAYSVLSQVWLQFKGFAQAGLWVFRARAAPYRAPVPWPVGACEAATLQTLLTSQHGAIHPVPSQGRSPLAHLLTSWQTPLGLAGPGQDGCPPHSGHPRCLLPNPPGQKPHQSVAPPNTSLPDAQGTSGPRSQLWPNRTKAPAPTSATQTHVGVRSWDEPGQCGPLVLLTSPPIPTPLLGLRAPPPRLGKVPGTTVPMALGQLGSVTSVRTQERTSLCPGVGTACILPVRKPHSRPWLP